MSENNILTRHLVPKTGTVIGEEIRLFNEIP